MKNLNKTLAAGALFAAVTGSALALSATSASADVACNRYGECWRVAQRYTAYPSNLGVTFHDDAWRAQNRNGHYRWRKDRTDDQGYYSRGHWRRFDK
jgi:hydroxyethylthiazole kinase-like sugar kinase family protein